MTEQSAIQLRTLQGGSGIGRLRHWIRKSLSSRGRSRCAAETAAQIVRLAETAPHLLRDVGFEEAPAPPCRSYRVLTRAGIEVLLWADRSVTVRQGLAGPDETGTP